MIIGVRIVAGSAIGPSWIRIVIGSAFSVGCVRTEERFKHAMVGNTQPKKDEGKQSKMFKEKIAHIFQVSPACVLEHTFRLVYPIQCSNSLRCWTKRPPN